MIPSITGHDRRTVLGKWHRGPDHLPFPAVNALNHAPCWETVGLFPFFPVHFLHLGLLQQNETSLVVQPCFSRPRCRKDLAALSEPTAEL